LHVVLWKIGIFDAIVVTAHFVTFALRDD